MTEGGHGSPEWKWPVGAGAARAGGAEASQGLRAPHGASTPLGGAATRPPLPVPEGQVRQESCPEILREGAEVPTQQSSLTGWQVAPAPSIYPSGPEKAGRSPGQRVIF